MAPAPDRAWDRQLRDAAEIQHQLTPRQFRCSGLEVAVRCEPLEEVGGDFVDVLKMSDGRVLLVVADVCGCGLPAALVAMSVHGIVRCCVQDGDSLGEIAQRLNAYLQFSHPDGPFVTWACAAIDLRSGASEALNAGHPPLLVIQPRGSVRGLKSGKTFPLGIAEIDPHTEADAVTPDEVVLVYSDGWTELCNPSGRMLGLTGLSRSVSSVCRDRGAAALEEILNTVRVRLARFQGDARTQDDRTLMLVRRQAAGE